VHYYLYRRIYIVGKKIEEEIVSSQFFSFEHISVSLSTTHLVRNHFEAF
jgi:hypothetical protein